MTMQNVAPRATPGRFWRSEHQNLLGPANIRKFSGMLNVSSVKHRGELLSIGIFVVVQLIKIADKKQFKADITNWIKDGIKEALKEEAKDVIRDGIKEALKEDREGDGKD